MRTEPAGMKICFFPQKIWQRISRKINFIFFIMSRRQQQQVIDPAELDIPQLEQFKGGLQAELQSIQGAIQDRVVNHLNHPPGLKTRSFNSDFL